MPDPQDSALLARVEAYYDAVPRPIATTAQVGPFTIFVADPATGWQFYARPSPGSHAFTAADVEAVLTRQDELGVPHAIEWVDEVTPSLAAAVRAAGQGFTRYPLLVRPVGPSADEHGTGATDAAHDVSDSRVRTRVLSPDDPELGLAGGAVGAAFGERDTVESDPVGSRPELIERGLLVVVAAHDQAGQLIGAGSAAPRGDLAELMGIGVPRPWRGRGVGSAITRALVAECAVRGVRTCLLSAASDGAASIYRRAGFRDIGTACIHPD